MSIVSQGLGSVGSGVVVSQGYGDQFIEVTIFFDSLDFISSLTIQIDLISHLLTVLNKLSDLTTQAEFNSHIKTQEDKVSGITTQVDFTTKLL